MMRYHKGLGIGHIYSCLKEDDALLQVADGSVTERSHSSTMANNDLDSVSSAAGDGWIIEDTVGLASSESDEDSLTDHTDSDIGGRDNDIWDNDSLDEGSGDSVDLEYQEMFGNSRHDSDYED